MLKVSGESSVLRNMINLENLSPQRFRKVCALVTASIILPVLAYADHDSGKWNKGDKDEHRSGDHDTDKGRDKDVPVVPEANAGWVLIPFFGAVLLFSARQLLRPNAAQK
jgi:hypothetical protein